MTQDPPTPGEVAVVTEADARAVAAAVAALTPESAWRRDGGGVSAARHLLGLVQAVESREAFDVLRAEAVPPLLALFDARLGAGAIDPATRDDLLFLLAVTSLFRDERVVDRVEAAARAGLGGSREDWTAILSAYDPAHPARVRLAGALRDPLPEGPLAAVYLAFANALAREGTLLSHPFDSEEGRRRLRDWLGDPAAVPAEYLAAAQALGHLGRDGAGPLLERAIGHRDPRVRVEALAVRARGGDDGAVGALVALAGDPRSARPAARALRGLGQGGRLPPTAGDGRFLALAELAHWLAHPNEFDRPPDRLDVLDTRTILWPPAGGERTLWLIRYAYDAPAPVEGFGLVGSVTYSQLGEPIAGRTADDLYALHCCWELQIRGDPRAPAEATVEAGRRLLGLDAGS